jgi:hypothetical protein
VCDLVLEFRRFRERRPLRDYDVATRMMGLDSGVNYLLGFVPIKQVWFGHLPIEDTVDE